MKNGIVLLVVFLVLSCQDIERVRKPDGLISEERMEDILMDAALINAVRTFSVTKLKQSGIEPDTFLYEKYGVDSLQLAESLKYYAVHYDDYLGMYRNINTRLEAHRTAADSLRKEEDKVKDSLRLLKSRKQRELDSLGIDTLDLDTLEPRPRPTIRRAEDFMAIEDTVATMR